MRGLKRRVETHPGTLRSEPHAELDVLDARFRVADGVEPARPRECIPADRSKPGPERRRVPGRLLVHEVMEQVAEPRHDSRCAGGFVVGAEERGQAGVVRKSFANPVEGIAVWQDVRVDENENLSRCTLRTCVARCRRTRARRFLHDDQILRRILRCANRGDDQLQ